MHAAHVLRPVAGERILDACAAPGGKAMHLLERAPGIRLTALDIDAERCDLIRAECVRLGVDATVVEGDATHLDWWDRQPYAAVLLDVPCSGTGTLRRHPDIKLLKRESDIDQYQQIQVDLLHNLWAVIEAGGRLLYCTCSILSRENDQVIDRFLTWTPDAAVTPIERYLGNGDAARPPDSSAPRRRRRFLLRAAQQTSVSVDLLGRVLRAFEAFVLPLILRAVGGDRVARSRDSLSSGTRATLRTSPAAVSAVEPE